MINISVEFKDIVIRSIIKNDLTYISQKFNNTKEYKYAIGFNGYIPLMNFTKAYIKLKSSKNEFVCGIYMKKEKIMLGIIKGRLINDKMKFLWINSLIIFSKYQRCGYGRKSIKTIITYFKYNYEIKSVFITVVANNHKGVKFWLKNRFTIIKVIKKNIFLNKKLHNIYLMHKKL